jgi:SAM-dependent methyltransferase
LKFKYTRADTPHFIIQTLLKYGLLINKSEIFEYGSTDFAVKDNPSQEEINSFLDFYNISDKQYFINKLNQNARIRMRDIWLSLGVQNIDSADGDGFECKALDFNKGIKKYFRKKYDLVLNLGTTEHVFNIAKAFEDTHNLCKKNGIILFAMPTKGYLNHGYYTINPKLLHDIAVFNCYEILGSYKQIATGAIGQEFIESVLPTDDFQYGLNTWHEPDIASFVFYRKLTNNTFKMPYETVSANIANKNVLFDYKKGDINCFFARNKMTNKSKVAIFGTKQAASLAYDFCKKHNIKIDVVIDDYEQGYFNDIKIVNKNEFNSMFDGKTNYILYGNGQKGIENFITHAKLICVPNF